MLDSSLEFSLNGVTLKINGLEDFSENALNEIKQFMESKNLTTNDLLIAYLEAVKRKCELESSLESVLNKIKAV